MSIQDQVRAFIASTFYAPAALDEEASLLDTGTIDSTGILEVIAFLEATFGITVDDREIVPENLDSIARIARYVARKREAAPTPIPASV